MRTAFRCVASRNRERGRGPRDEASQSPVGAQPSRGESISFLSPAQAAGAPTFCDATESRQRTQPRGFPPPWLTPAFSDHPPENVRPCAPPFEAVHLPAGVPSGTAEAGDAKHRDKFSPKLRPHAFLRALPSRRDGRAGRLPLGRDAQRLLLPASTPNDPPGRPTPKNGLRPQAGAEISP